MALIRFLFRIVFNLIGAVVLLLFIASLGLWFWGRWYRQETVVSWVQHAPDHRDILHSTQIVSGGNLYINDTEDTVVQEPTAAPTTGPTTAPAVAAAPTTQPGAFELKGVTPPSRQEGYSLSSGRG